MRSTILRNGFGLILLACSTGMLGSTTCSVKVHVPAVRVDITDVEGTIDLPGSHIRWHDDGVLVDVPGLSVNIH